jgi:hypothetical protein
MKIYDGVCCFTDVCYPTRGSSSLLITIKKKKGIFASENIGKREKC